MSDLHPPELAALGDVAERPRAGNWSLRAAMTRYAQGQQVYTARCAACHQLDGKGIPGAFPAIAGSQVATGELSRHMDVVIHGIPGTAMQAFGAQLTPVETAAVITYERNAFGNNMGDQVQPVDVVNFQQGQ